MGFPTRACMELTSVDMKQSLRLVKDVSLSMSWNAESLPMERGGEQIKNVSLTQSCNFIQGLGNYNY